MKVKALPSLIKSKISSIFGPSGQQNTILMDDVNSVHKYNVWLYVLVAFLILYSGYLLFKYDGIDTTPTSVHFVTETNRITLILQKTNTPYAIGEIVGIKYFGVHGIIVSTPFLIGHEYQVMYKDDDGTLQTVTIDRDFLYKVSNEDLLNLILAR